MSELQIVNGSASKKTYVVIAKTKTAELCVRPLVVTRHAVNRSGKFNGKRAVVPWFRVHLQRPDRMEIPSERMNGSWGLGLDKREGPRYYRTDTFIQAFIQGEATLKYGKEKVRLGLATMLDEIMSKVTANTTSPDKEEVLDWLMGQMEHKIAAYTKTDVKNTAGFVAKVQFGVDG